ncbi:GumC family protein [Sphingobacterium corticibacterium]|uniref:non-specific protein-tyrosine kinase n=1 Tax=Sphingobacterium corticibacterium TaxID=2484746 RepID=A0A4Q6XVH7_9SPHI|nr:polysaccharide biosynthesis tyrosine autokinase [Sphingobacterium corticibacterium]RZF61692.1 polysaccharide biosynthesis tyrosine autokinase [Sphingobacterium corticibacterium]
MHVNQYSGIGADGKKEQSINIIDIVKYLLFHWKWFVLSVLVFGAIYYYQYNKSPFIYRSTETVMIKTPTNTPVTARLTRTNATNSVSVKSEILQLRSKELMETTVQRIGAETNYLERVGLRDNELYRTSPVEVTLAGKSEDIGYDILVTPLDANQVSVRKRNGQSQDEEVKVPLHKETKTPFGLLTVRATPFYNEASYGRRIRVVRQPLETVVSYFLSRLSVQQIDGDAALLQVAVEDTNPHRAAALITELIAVYNEVALSDKNQVAVNTEEFIRDRLAIIESELGSVESNIERLQAANQGMDAKSAGQMHLADSRQFQSERTKIETDINLANMMREYLTEKDGQYELMPNNTGLVEANVESQINEYNTMLLRRNRLVEGSSTANPVVVDLDRNLASMRDNIYEAMDNAMRGLNIKLNNVIREEQAARGKAVQAPRQQRMMLSVERQQKVKEELYLYLLNKREENAINRAMTDESIRIVDSATRSGAPISPNKMRKLAMGVAIGLVLPAAILLLVLMVDTKVRNRQDLEGVLSVPFLGEIPLSKRKTKDKSHILVRETGRDPLTEAFRILRTNISFMSRDGKEAQVITLTSFGIGVGKTFTSLNLATTLSYLGKKVAVVDLDLRKGSLTTRVGLDGAKGVSHYLSNPAIPIDVILHSSEEIPNLHFFPIGAMAPNPVELLLSKRLDDMMQTLRNQYDYIIVDGVPIGIVADAGIVDRISDLTLFIIRSGRMDRRQLPDIERIYREKKINNLAVVLNGLKLGSAGYGYGTYGYGGYGYGYGYGLKEKRGFSRLFKRS